MQASCSLQVTSSTLPSLYSLTMKNVCSSWTYRELIVATNLNFNCISALAVRSVKSAPYAGSVSNNDSQYIMYNFKQVKQDEQQLRNSQVVGCEFWLNPATGFWQVCLLLFFLECCSFILNNCKLYSLIVNTSGPVIWSFLFMSQLSSSQPLC